MIFLSQIGKIQENLEKNLNPLATYLYIGNEYSETSILAKSVDSFKYLEKKKLAFPALGCAQ